MRTDVLLSTDNWDEASFSVNIEWSHLFQYLKQYVEEMPADVFRPVHASPVALRRDLPSLRRTRATAASSSPRCSSLCDHTGVRTCTSVSRKHTGVRTTVKANTAHSSIRLKIRHPSCTINWTWLLQVGLLDRHRVLNLFEMFNDRAREDIKEAFRNPRECKSLLYVLQTPTPPHPPTHTRQKEAERLIHKPLKPLGTVVGVGRCQRAWTLQTDEAFCCDLQVSRIFCPSFCRLQICVLNCTIRQ